MATVRPIIQFECQKCKKFYQSFFFADESENCSECNGNLRITASKIKFHNRVSELGGIILGKYRNHKTKIKCRCKNGHDCYPTPRNIQRHGMCVTCAGKDSSISEANFLKRIAELRGKVLGEYQGSRVPVKCECKEGHECSPYPFRIQRGGGMCRICSGSDFATAELKFRRRITELGGKVLGEYKGSNIAVKCECEFGHECNPLPASVRRWGMCKICAGTDSATAESNFRKRISELGGKVLGNYRGNRIPIKCECKEGHECNIMPTCIQQGQGMCKMCAGIDPIIAESKFRERISQLGGKVLGEYRGSRAKVKCECKNGHECNISPGTAKYWGICMICAGHDFAIAETNFRKRIAELGGKVLGEYQGSRIPVKCECKEGHECSPYPSGIQRGGGMCSSCGLKSEPLCREIFEDFLNCSMRKTRPSWLIWKHGKPLELDGYNEEKKVAFEYQGVQHTEYNSYFHRNGPDDLECQQERDTFKAQVCLNMGITLICVPCDYNHRAPELMKKYIKTELIRCGIFSE